MTAERLLHALAEGGTYSSEELARTLGITRAAVTQHVAKLTAWGIAVEAVHDSAYRLPQRLDLLEAAALRAALEPQVAARLAKLEIFTELDSTNSRLLAEPPAVGRLDVCVAEYQTAGRGRRGRRWHVPFAGGVCLSVGWQFPRWPAGLPALTLAVGVAVRRALQRVAGLDVALKWPNDLVVDERKLGGILLEVAAGAPGPAHVVAGVGLNVALPRELLESLSDWPRGAIDLRTALGHEPPPRAAVVGALVNELCALLVDYPQTGFAAYGSEWRDADHLLGRRVAFDDPAGPVVGTALGIDADGALLVAAEDGREQRVVSGDVTVRERR